jgi:hypothetical protein
VSRALAPFVLVQLLAHSPTRLLLSYMPASRASVLAKQRWPRPGQMPGPARHFKSNPHAAMIMIPETNYARSGRVDLAYKVLADGPRDLVFAAAGPSHLEVLWELPEHVSAMERLARFGRVIMFDKWVRVVRPPSCGVMARPSADVVAQVAPTPPMPSLINGRRSQLATSHEMPNAVNAMYSPTWTRWSIHHQPNCVHAAPTSIARKEAR